MDTMIKLCSLKVLDQGTKSEYSKQNCGQIIRPVRKDNGTKSRGIFNFENPECDLPSIRTGGHQALLGRSEWRKVFGRSGFKSELHCR